MSLVNVATGVLLAKDLLSSRKSNRPGGTKGKSSKGIGTFGKIILAVGGAVAANWVVNKYFKDDLTDRAGDGTKQGKVSDYAQRLYDAFFPSGQSYIWDGTDEGKVKAVAIEVKANNLHADTVAAYRTLFKRSLIDDLRSEGVYDDYFGVLNGTTPTTPTTPTNPSNGTRVLTKGATIYGYGGYTVRTINGAKVRSSVAGEAWQIVSWKTETLAGTTGVWVEVKKKDINIVTTYKVFVKGLYFK